MNRSKFWRAGLHLIGVSIVLTLILEIFNWPLGVYVPRRFRRVEVVEIQGVERNWVQGVSVRHGSNPIPEWTILRTDDCAKIRLGSKVWLMTADWNFKGPKEQTVTFWRLLKAYHFHLAAAYLLWLLALFSRWLWFRGRA